MKAENVSLMGYRPPLGWNSWNTFTWDINETLIKEVADLFVTEGYKDAGYEYIVIDDCWSLKQRDENGNLIGDLIPIDFAMNAAAYGAKTYTAKTLEELEAALIDSKKQNVSTLIDIKVLPKSMTDGYGAWWHVGIASTSEKEAVNSAYKNKEENLRKARKF